MINRLHMAMIELYKGDAKRIQHFCKVHSYARLIAQMENVDDKCLFIIETVEPTGTSGLFIRRYPSGSSESPITAASTSVSLLIAGLYFLKYTVSSPLSLSFARNSLFIESGL